MRNRTVLCLLLLSISFSTIASAQVSTANYRMPREVNLDRIVHRTFPSYYGRNYPGGIYNQLYTDGFYPIGWSRDGKLAYYVEPVDEACGCYFAELKIVDLRTDTVVWEFKNEPQERVDASGAPLDDDMQLLWKRNQQLFNSKLNEYGIVASQRFVLLGRNFNSGGKAYAAKLRTLKSEKDDDYLRVMRATLEFSSPTLGKKTLYTVDHSAEQFAAPLDMAVAGAFKSPFENRAAIVMIKVQRGYEGPPHTVDIRIAGADLKNGFKK